MSDTEILDRRGFLRKRRAQCKYGHQFDGTEKWKTNWKGYSCRVCRECAKLRMQRMREDPAFLAYGAERQRKHREKQGPAYLAHVRDERRKKKEWLDALKVKCSRCEQAHVACLEFHHRNPAEKDFLLSVGVAKYSLKRLQAEVDKCEVICSNCHRIHHWEERQKTKSEGD
jgi:hypothetical protein